MKEITQIRKLSLGIFIIPLLGINLCLIISQNPEFLENTYFAVDQIGRSGFSIPYLDGSLSISRASRTFPQYLIFKPAMIVTAVTLYYYWLNNNKLINKCNFTNIDYKELTNDLPVYKENNEIVEMESNRTVVKNSSGNEIMIISDVNTSNAILHSGVTKPDDWFGYKYIYANGGWSLNEDWEDPRDDDISYSLSSDVTSINEGNSVTFQVTGNSTASSDKTFTYQVDGNANGSTSAASSSDFSPSSGTLGVSFETSHTRSPKVSVVES